MTGQHTPGPWKWNGAAGIYGANGKRCANVFVQDEIDLPNEEVDANAHLIEAAPELLEVAKGCWGYLLGLPVSHRPDDIWFKPLTDAIAKAEP